MFSPLTNPFSLKRPDDVIHPGEDTQTEWDLAQAGNFIANFEPLRPAAIREIVDDVSGLEKFSQPMREFFKIVANARPDSYVVASDHTRLVAGKPTANPRYLQTRPDAVNPEGTYLAAIGQRLARRIPEPMSVVCPVGVTLMGRRISKPGPNLPTLTVFGPIHYQELPELFMDLFCCVSGTSPSTTGAGSEGALTKGPFNACPFSADLNNLLTCYMLTGIGGWSTPTGFVGPKMQFAHDASFLSPEVWCRMKPHERDPEWLKLNGYIEPVKDFEYQGRKIIASRIGYRITEKFAHFLGRVFEAPRVVFEDEVLRPEKQDLAKFVEGIDEILTVQKVIAQRYFEDGTVDLLVPPLKALLHIMVHGSYEGKDLSSPEIRSMFTREALLKSKWYYDRLVFQQKRDITLWSRHVETLEKFVAVPGNAEPVQRLSLDRRLALARAKLQEVSSPKYPESLVGTIGADPITVHK